MLIFIGCLFSMGAYYPTFTVLACVRRSGCVVYIYIRRGVHTLHVGKVTLGVDTFVTQCAYGVDSWRGVWIMIHNMCHKCIGYIGMGEYVVCNVRDAYVGRDGHGYYAYICISRVQDAQYRCNMDVHALCWYA